MLHDRDVLLSHLRNDNKIQPPYSSSQINESAMRAAISRIYAQASPQTKAQYERAHNNNTIDLETGLPVWDNWIIRWMLWHAFRYRDSRNKHSPIIWTANTQTESSAGSVLDDDQIASQTANPAWTASEGTHSPEDSTTMARYLQSREYLAEQPPANSEAGAKLPYDPIRDL